MFTLDDLRRVMRACAGEDESVDLDGDIAEVSFLDLGYDSLALMETASRIERELDLSLPEERVAEMATPEEFLLLVNSHLAKTA